MASHVWRRYVRNPVDRFRALRRLARFHAKPRSLEETVRWALNFGTHGKFKVRTLQVPSEILALAQAVQALQPKTILEIGTSHGGTLLLWAQIASERVISCDIRDMTAERVLYERFPPPGSACRVQLLTGDSHSPAFRERVVAALEGNQVDFLFIDGDHTEVGVGADHRDYAPLVRPGGLIAFHDIAEQQPLESNQVQHFWRKLLQTGVQTEEFIADRAQCGYGIGLVRVSGDASA